MTEDNLTMTALNNSPNAPAARQPRRVRLKTPSSLSGMLEGSKPSAAAAKPVEHEHRRSKALVMSNEELQLLARSLRRAKRRLLLAAVAQPNDIHQDSQEFTESDDSELFQTRSEAFAAS
ncbi:hypothetical protein MPSEU_000169500 [Mayamaea pseudoterrestris]|nr:hypothetical protein MPSEU_000169500 [Mayamaea pseudoterrestris]